MIHHVIKRIGYRFSSLKVPIVDIESFLKGNQKSNEDCKKVADAFRDYGCLIIKDPRIKQQQNSAFLDMLENYFLKRSTQFYDGKQIQDIYPQYDYEVGATPQYKGKIQADQVVIKSLTQQNKPLTPIPSPRDAKWRYLWNVGKSEDDFPNQSPKDFPQWQNVMNTWGNHMINGCMTVAQMSALGMGLQKNTFTELMRNGPHKLAPTAGDLAKFDVGTVFTGFHYDFNFLTIHGKSRYPGLIMWLKTGQKFTVSVPEGHLLLQAGTQFQYLTGGYVTSGYHQVVYTNQVKQAKQKAIRQGKIPWRISSTLFSHLRYNEIMKPIGKFATEDTIKKYPAIKVKDFVEGYFNDRKRNI